MQIFLLSMGLTLDTNMLWFCLLQDTDPYEDCFNLHSEYLSMLLLCTERIQWISGMLPIRMALSLPYITQKTEELYVWSCLGSELHTVSIVHFLSNACISVKYFIFGKNGIILPSKAVYCSGGYSWVILVWIWLLHICAQEMCSSYLFRCRK